MSGSSLNANPLVSIIIPCFNHGRYVMDAIESIWQQGYPSVEIIVVDDGSTDNTAEIVKGVERVKYIYQKNSGLSAARNTGIKNSTGEFLIFLDADDWLLPGAITTNISYLERDKTLAFVSGAHEKVFVDIGETIYEFQEADSNHYIHFLQGNYIGMIATVMYRRRIFDCLLFDETLKASEDYDLYFKIARSAPVIHHSQKIAAYRIHNSNMSGNIPMMLSATLKILDRQKSKLLNQDEKNALENGYKIYIDYYCSLLYNQLISNNRRLTGNALLTLIKFRPKLGLKFILKRQSMLKSFIKKNMPVALKRRLHKAGFYRSYCPPVGSVKKGDFDRLTPFSTNFGFDRGGAVDRYYIEKFLGKVAARIKGRCLEIGDNEYTLLFGGDKVAQSDILHIDASNQKATFVGDLSNAPQLPDNTFDCIVLTQTLHLIYDFKGALNTCYRILKPGGVLLLTSPGITPIDHGEWKKTWYWSFTDSALKKLIAETFPTGNFEVETFGNVYVAAAFLFGIGIAEVSQKQLDYHDPHFQVIITVMATKG